VLFTARGSGRHGFTARGSGRSARGDPGGMGSALPRHQVPAVVASTTASDLVVSLSIGRPVRPDDSRMIQCPVQSAEEVWPTTQFRACLPLRPRPVARRISGCTGRHAESRQ